MIPPPGAAVRVEAPAKVNLLLRILGRRPDGYHALETLFQAVGLTDTLLLERIPGDGLELVVEGAEVGPPEENLVTRAVRLFQGASGQRAGLRATLVKRIPAGAGLGGGSSDAGATLRGLNLLHATPLAGEELVELGGELGADVAFFAGEAGLAAGEGRGERLTPLPPLPPRTLVLGLPRVHVATGPAYRALAEARQAAGGSVPSRILHPVPTGWPEVEARAVNDFQEGVAAAHAPVAEALAALEAEGASTALLSGSGAAVFGVFPADVPLDRVRAGLSRRAPETPWVAVPTLDRLPSPGRVEPPQQME